MDQINEEIPDVLYLSDGGHMENLALLPLLNVKCRKIYLIDCEAATTCNSLINALQLARKHLNIKFFDGTGFDIAAQIIDYEKNNNINMLQINVTYADQSSGIIYYFKAKPDVNVDEGIYMCNNTN